MSSSKKQSCDKCGSEKIYGMSRIVGYFSKIANWLPSKKNEYKARMQGDYKLSEDDKKE